MFRTFTFVVRMSEDDIRDLEGGQVADPRIFLTDDEVMFWGEESGISPTAMKLGAEPGDWADEDDDEDKGWPLTPEEREALEDDLRPFSMSFEGRIGGVQYVTVLDSGGNPMEYNIPIEEARERYGIE